MRRHETKARLLIALLLTMFLGATATADTGNTPTSSREIDEYFDVLGEDDLVLGVVTVSRLPGGSVVSKIEILALSDSGRPLWLHDLGPGGERRLGELAMAAACQAETGVPWPHCRLDGWQPNLWGSGGKLGLHPLVFAERPRQPLVSIEATITDDSEPVGIRECIQDKVDQGIPLRQALRECRPHDYEQE